MAMFLNFRICVSIILGGQKYNKLLTMKIVEVKMRINR